jgi:hypothetical protein
MVALRMPTMKTREKITDRFALGEFPLVSEVTLGGLIVGSWKGSFGSAAEMFRSGIHLWSLQDS